MKNLLGGREHALLPSVSPDGCGPVARSRRRVKLFSLQDTMRPEARPDLDVCWGGRVGHRSGDLLILLEALTAGWRLVLRGFPLRAGAATGADGPLWT